jgi:hypothetical protein
MADWHLHAIFMHKASAAGAAAHHPAQPYVVALFGCCVAVNKCLPFPLLSKQVDIPIYAKGHQFSARFLWLSGISACGG